MVSVRTTHVNTKYYLQVVDYFTDPASHKHRVKVLKSFGQPTLANRLASQAFAAQYNLLNHFLQDEITPDERKDPHLVAIVYSIFGPILGATIIDLLLQDVGK